jgi:hypothetical protein
LPGFSRPAYFPAVAIDDNVARDVAEVISGNLARLGATGASIAVPASVHLG